MMVQSNIPSRFARKVEYCNTSTITDFPKKTMSAEKWHSAIMAGVININSISMFQSGLHPRHLHQESDHLSWRPADLGYQQESFMVIIHHDQSLSTIHYTRWCPPSYKLFYNPHEYYRYNPLINPSFLVLINQLNANELGHHIISIMIHWSIQI